MKKTSWAVITAIIALSATTYGSITYEFVNGGEFDGKKPGWAGSTVALSDGGYNFTLTLVDVIDSAGASVLGGSDTRVNIGTGGALGVDSRDVVPADASTTSFNDGEAAIFSFDQDVVLDATQTTSVNLTTDTFFLTILDGSNGGAGNEIQLDNGTQLINVALSAGTNFKLHAPGGTARLTSLTVTAIPEPASIGLIGIAVTGLLAMRRLFN